MDNQLAIRVTPKASRNKIDIDPNGNIKIYVTAPPEDGKANQAVCELITKTLKVSKNSIQIISGHKTRDKIIELKMLSQKEAIEIIKGQLGKSILPGLDNI